MPIFAHIRRLTSYLRLPIFIKILNVLDLQFQGQRFELNTLTSAYVKSAWNALQSLSETLHSLYRHDGRYRSARCQAMSRGASLCHHLSPSYVKRRQSMSPPPFAKLCQEVPVYVTTFRQAMSRGASLCHHLSLSCVKRCQSMSRFLREMHALHSRQWHSSVCSCLCVCACLYVCVHSFERLIGGPHKNRFR